MDLFVQAEKRGDIETEVSRVWGEKDAVGGWGGGGEERAC